MNTDGARAYDYQCEACHAIVVHVRSHWRRDHPAACLWCNNEGVRKADDDEIEVDYDA